MITPSRNTPAILDSRYVEDATTSVSGGAHLFEHRMLD